MKLTQRIADALKLPAGKTDHIVFDDTLGGFGLRLRESGSRSWIYQYQIGTKQRRMVVGNASALSLERARQTAAELHAKVRLGNDPAADREARVADAALTFGAVAARFLARQRQRLRPRSYVEAERHLLRGAKNLHALPIANVDRRTIAGLLGTLSDVCGMATANRARSTMSALFSWAIKEGLIELNPVTGTNKHAEHSRDRTLTDHELAAVWKSCGDDDDYGHVTRLLMLTGCRRNEIAGLRMDEIDLERRMITLPASRVKNGRALTVPISSSTETILRQVGHKEGGLLFSRREGRALNGWSAAKVGLDRRIAAMIGKPLPSWTLHDLRRTCATRMAELGVQPHIIEAVLNHVSGHRAGVAGIYNRAAYAVEKAQALTLWADHIAALVEGRPSNVTPLRRA